MVQQGDVGGSDEVHEVQFNIKRTDMSNGMLKQMRSQKQHCSEGCYYLFTAFSFKYLKSLDMCGLIVFQSLDRKKEVVLF